MEALHFLQDLVDTARENAGDSSEQVLELVNLLHSPGGTHTASSQSSKNFEYPDNIGIPYEPDEFGLEKARKDCRLEMLKIVKEVDEVIANPMLALDPERDLQYTNPTFFRRLLPVSCLQTARAVCLSFPISNDVFCRLLRRLRNPSWSPPLPPPPPRCMRDYTMLLKSYQTTSSPCMRVL